MFGKLFAESGLSLDRLRAMLEVGAAGSIVKAADADPVRQSQYSRQIKELEDFFRTKLIERHGKGMQLTANGKELARISRFFLLGLSNFQRGCLSEEQSFRIAGSATVLHRFLTPVLGNFPDLGLHRFQLEVAEDDQIEHRLHDLTLDFAIVTNGALSRPLQVKEIGTSKLVWLAPKKMNASRAAAKKALLSKSVPLTLSSRETPPAIVSALGNVEPTIQCDSFLSASIVLESSRWNAILPDFLVPENSQKRFWLFPLPVGDGNPLRYYFAWNPRLIRLNPHVARTRDLLIHSLATSFRNASLPRI